MRTAEGVFSVDTHLFRELGDLLVGRDSTALFELIKNAYDADASEVDVSGINLDDAENGLIMICDNGSGMDINVFRNGFLRIASRLKDSGDKRSSAYHRRFTGAKGIGRLAAHKLASLLQIESVYGRPGGKSTRGIVAKINWDAIESLQTLEQIQEGNEVSIREDISTSPKSVGTLISLRSLRRSWTSEERTAFVSECQSFQPPLELVSDLVPKYLKAPLLFSKPNVREQHKDDPGFVLNLGGEFTVGESLWNTIASTSQWLIEVDATPSCANSKHEIRFGVGPTKKAVLEKPLWRSRTFTVFHPYPDQGPFFQARIFVQFNPKDTPETRRKIRAESGLRVYVEGFRILPYGEPGNDWLSLDAEATRNTNFQFADFVNEVYGDAVEDKFWEETLLPSRSYFGGIFLTQQGATGLRPLINREGFLPDPAFEFLRDTIRKAIGLGARVRAAATFQERMEARASRKKRREAVVRSTESKKADLTDNEDSRTPFTSPSKTEPLAVIVGQVTTQLRTARDLLVSGNPEAVATLLENMPLELDTIQDAAERLSEEGPMIRVLASVGAQMAAFVHEIRSLLGTATAVEEAIQRVTADEASLPGDSRQQLTSIRHTIGELRRHLERQASYLLDIVSPDASRRKSRQKLSERFESGAKFMRMAAERRGISIVNQIPEELRTPPMFPAEIASVFSNLLSNAIKAAGDNGRVLATGKKLGDTIVVRVENTGVKVDIADSEHWFHPFESSTTEIDTYLGQGMGLGLTITRNLLEPYGATIRFVDPEPTFSTALEITFKE